MYAGEVTVRVCYGHRLHGYNGRCARLHGHNGVVTVCVEATDLDAQGFVADFYDVKQEVSRVVDRFDHAMILGPTDPLLPQLRAMREHHVEIATPPTAENLAQLVFDGLCESAGASRRWRVRSVRWEEEPGFVAVCERDVTTPLLAELLDAHDPSIPPRPARGPVSCWSCRGEVASAAETYCLRCRAQGKVEVPRG